MAPPDPDHRSERVLVCAPAGRDSEIAGTLLAAAGAALQAVKSAVELAASMDDGVLAVVITEEELAKGDLRALVAWVEGQAPWSDLPFVILVRQGGGPERNPIATRFTELLGNVTFIERPFHATTFISVVRSALKGRRRQYQMRDRMAELRDSERSLREAELRLRSLNDDLERRVAERTTELEEAHRNALAEASLREGAEMQLRQAQKMEMIGQLTGGVAHDFNNLLTAVIGSLDLLRRNLPDDPKLGRLIHSALQGANRGAALTQRLLAFARRQDLQIKAASIAGLIDGMEDLLAKSVDPLHVTLAYDIAPDLPPALIDANQVELAILNLVVNSRDAMPGGGEIRIAAALPEAELPPELAPGRYVCLAVTDNGVGMDANTLARATEPFFSTKELGKGTGLGLSMIHGLAIQHHGTLRLTSEPERGTRAELWFPVAPSAQPVPVEEPALAEAADDTRRRPRRLRVLLVDDDALISMSTAAMLEDLGHQVVEADSGATALGVLDAGEPFDLVITDYSMPRMNGGQFAAEVRKRLPDMPILLATGYADLPEGVQLDLPRLPKPYHQQRLDEEIRRLV
jgi:signal transduction histidine kinase/CheY-like chemotaxis protein